VPEGDGVKNQSRRGTLHVPEGDGVKNQSRRGTLHVPLSCEKRKERTRESVPTRFIF